MRTLSTLLIITLLYGCFPTNPDKNQDIAYRINTMRPDMTMTANDVREARSKTLNVPPCRYDKNRDGEVNTQDLVTLLPNMTTSDLVQFLSVYGESYIVDIVPAWNNFIQDFNCNLGWDTFIRTNCEGQLSAYNEFDGVEWYDQDGNLISTNPEKLDFQNYENGEPLKSCSGWQPPCNGINTVTLVVINDGYTFSRTADGWVRTNNFPEDIPICGNAGQAPNLFSGNFEPYEFLVE